MGYALRVLAECLRQLHNSSMVSITVRNVPAEVRDELAERAARAGRSLEAHLRVELTELARRPTIDDLLQRIRARKQATGTRLPSEQILAHRDADRQ